MEVYEETMKYVQLALDHSQTENDKLKGEIKVLTAGLAERKRSEMERAEEQAAASSKKKVWFGR